MRDLSEIFRIKILKCCWNFERRRKQDQTQIKLFRETYPDLPPLSHETVSKTDQQLPERDHG